MACMSKSNFLLIVAASVMLMFTSKAFTLIPPSVVSTTRGAAVLDNTSSDTTAITKKNHVLQMGFFDALNKAFTNEEYAAPPEGIKATARHILVPTAEDAEMIISKLSPSGGSTFASLANEYSSCPSASRGGSLGSFAPGTMVAEFDAVVFNPDTSVGEVVGPVATKFGYHLIVVDKRTGV